jgi:nitroimidazol reductase NimA-like FMN-containing flavoprotein (pyridoxamine 5'-phosphate oxidase superfamily)
MIGTLSPEEIEATLRRNRVGRLACSVNDRPYVVPINYAYDGTFVYAYSTAGRKIAVMREQPLVCFEVDEFDECSSWRSVVAEGRYEELTDGLTRDAALRLLTAGDPVSRGLDGHGVHQVVVFRIRLTDKSGRFERRDA